MYIINAQVTISNSNIYSNQANNVSCLPLNFLCDTPDRGTLSEADRIACYSGCWQGSGVFVYSGTVSMVWCQIYSNTASTGETLLVSAGSTVTMDCCTVSGSIQGTALQQCTLPLPLPPAPPPASPPPISCGPSTTLNAANGQCEIACADGSNGRRMVENTAAEPLPLSASLHQTLLARVQLQLDRAQLLTRQMTKDELEDVASTIDALLDTPHFGRPTFA